MQNVLSSIKKKLPTNLKIQWRGKETIGRHLQWKKVLVQFRSVTQSCPTLCDPSIPTPGAYSNSSPSSDAIQPSHPLSSLSPPVFSLSQHQGLFQWVSSSHQVARVLEFQLQHHSFQWIFRTDFLAVQRTLRSLLQHHRSKASILQRSAFFIVQLSHPYMTIGKTIALTRWTVV